MRGIVLMLIGLALAGCAETRSLDLKSMNAGSLLTPAEEVRLKALAEQGDAKAAKRVAAFYDEGLGDSRGAIPWLRLAAEAGDLEGEYNYAIMITAVDDPPSRQTQTESRKWIEKAAAGGYKPAIATLARLKRGEPL